MNKIKPRSSTIPPKTIRNRLQGVSHKFTFNDLYKHMNNRKVFGNYSESHIRNIISKARSYNMIVRDNKGQLPAIYKKKY